MARVAAGSHSSADVCRIVGCTYRQLDYWCRAGWITPSIPADGQGTQRRFCDVDVAQVRRVKMIADARRRPLAELLAV